MNAPIACDDALLETVVQAGLDTLDGAFAYGGGQDLVKAGLGGRRRTRLVLPDAQGRCRQLYLKRYGRASPAGWLRRLVSHGRTCSPARTEFENIRAAAAAGIATMEGVIFGEDSPRPWLGRSYIIVTAVPGDAMERCLEQFLASNPGHQAGEAISRKLAKMVSALHAGGWVHRDLYAAHIFLDESADGVCLYLIDLARMFRPRRRHFRWRVKDLAQLRYSMPAVWTDRWWDFFLAEYLGPQRQAQGGRYNRAIDRKVRRMLRRSRGKQLGKPAETGKE